MSRIALSVEHRTYAPGPFRLEAVDDHVVTVHAGDPARVSCHGGAVRAVATRGEISVLPVGTADECLQDDPTEVVNLRLPRALLRLAAEELDLDPDRAAFEPRFCFRDRSIEHIVWALEADRSAGSPGGLLYRESLGLALAARLLEQFRATPAARGGLSAQQFARVRDHIEANLAGDVSLVRLARVAGVSCSHFRVLFKRTTGLSPHAYVIERRVGRARTLLLDGALPAVAVAEEAGFAHQSHMARAMRRVLGVTPAAVGRARR